jgi:predicted  nucleic acid-binding Zn-ribbon protein
MSQDLLSTYTKLDQGVRTAEKELSELESQLKHYEQREKEIYESLGVKNLAELEAKLASLRGEVDLEMAEWSDRLVKVNDIIRGVEQRVAGVR